MDLTHLAAIGVGVFIGLLFVGFSKSRKEEPPAVAAPAGTTTGAKKKKKKKKKNKKKAKSEPVADEPEAEAPAPEAPAESSEDEAEPEVEAPPAAAPKTAGGKKKKKKKKNASGATANVSTTAGAPATAEAAPPPKAAPAPVVAPEPAYVATPFQPRVAVEEEAWETIPKKKKKKKNNANNAGGAAKKTPKAAPAGASTTVSIDASRVGIIIGPKGATMIAIQEKTGTKLDVNAPKADDGASSSGNNGQFRPVVRGKKKPTASVVITEGSAEGQRTARQAVLELADRGYAALLQAEGFGESSVSVHPRFLSEIVGPGGKIIKAIQTGLDVKLTIPKTDWTPKTIQVGNVEPSVRLGIAGDSPQNVKKAKQVIKDICAYHHHPVTHPGMVHQELYVPQEFFHCVIGTRGSEIKHIRGNYHVDVHMPSGESWCVTENVICVGRAKDVEKAISYIKLLMDRDTEVREQKYSDEAYGDDSGW